MSIQTACSSQVSVPDAVQEIGSQLQGGLPRLVVFFASAKYDPVEISAGMRGAFKNCQVIGCTTAGEIISGKMLKGSVVAMAIGSDIVDGVAVEIIPSIKSSDNVGKAFARIEKRFGAPMGELDIEKYVGIILVDGLRSAEERLMMRIGDLTDITFIGGSAGDDLAFKQTFVYADGKSYSDAAAIAVLKLKKGFEVIKTQSFRVMDKTLAATKVDEGTRTVFEFNGKPAVSAYAEALGIRTEDASNCFMKHPLGLLTGAGRTVCAQPATGERRGDAILLYYQRRGGASLPESTDIVGDTKQAIRQAEQSLGGIAGMINFHCILRTLELEQKNQTEAYGRIMEAAPTVGFSTYGEEYIGHINQTSTILVFK